ncbi:spermidine/putrescine transport system permease protein [Tistlia consotensis]|uniref:Spermidine/putrescine transport system permease protein n=1 Tax=Tistlia consotensis USBA 355 TaxID=560819 RepID=A0A1Y6CAG4_9PROT|nr:ABC transporter permease [Tistlia consotensis]SMF51555.1 spermidine/putrescine transport system permease protein [Tistlia consotensis USBA 355]SNR84032.1 spermidine/putrescine transport system permease protein [Tistlia consotensis]
MPDAPRTLCGRLRGWGFVLPGLVWTLAFFLLPLAVMALYSLWQRLGMRLVTELSLANYRAFLAKSFFLESLLNSIEVTVTVTLLSILFAYPLAWILAEKVPPRWQRIGLALAVLPFWTSYVVRSYSWLLVLSEGGLLSTALQDLGLVDGPVSLANSRAGTVIGFVHFFVMLLTLTIYANLSQLPRNYRRAAQDLGAGPVRTFLHVILPLTLPGIMVGAFLTFVLCIGDYITPQILGGNRELLLPQTIMLQIARRSDFPMASALAMVLMALVTLVYLACARWLKLERV